MDLAYNLKPSARIRRLAPFILLATVSFLSAAAQDSAREMSWHNLSTLAVEGKGWTTTKSLYDRLPAKAEGVVRPEVWDLSLDSSGLRYRFVTDAPELRGRWKLRREGHLALPHMPATGVSGLDSSSR